MISIEVPVTWGTYLHETLESLRQQTMQDFEVVLSCSNLTGNLKDVIQEYDVRTVTSGTPLLQKRYAAHSVAKGDQVLLLDETRVLKNNALMVCSLVKEDMAVIAELDIESNIWNKLTNVDKRNSIGNLRADPVEGFLLPRYFKSSLLTQAFLNVRQNLSPGVFDKVMMEDHQLLFFEAFGISRSIGYIDEILILHHGEENLLELVKKYFGYGKSHNVLKNSHYDSLTPIGLRARHFPGKDRLKILIFELIRGIPFMMGYACGKGLSELTTSE